ncbi:MAG TPA: hypothetical protein VKE91_11860 [Blastocatellia bacterium]|nr:hypothetical protein [Blastocatellia bacterium]
MADRKMADRKMADRKMADRKIFLPSSFPIFLSAIFLSGETKADI